MQIICLIRCLLSEYIKHAHVEDIKLLEENIGCIHFDTHHCKILFDSPPRLMKIETKINKWDFIKLKRVFTAKEKISKIRRQPLGWEKIIANKTIDKGLISKIYN